MKIKLPEGFAKEFEKARVRKAISKSQLSRDLGISRPMVHKIIKNCPTMMETELYNKIIDILDVPFMFNQYLTEDEKEIRDCIKNRDYSKFDKQFANISDKSMYKALLVFTKLEQIKQKKPDPIVVAKAHERLMVWFRSEIFMYTSFDFMALITLVLITKSLGKDFIGPLTKLNEYVFKLEDGDSRRFIRGVTNIASLKLTLQGKSEEAITISEYAIEAMRKTGFFGSLPFAHLVLAEANYVLGKPYKKHLDNAKVLNKLLKQSYGAQIDDFNNVVERAMLASLG